MIMSNRFPRGPGGRDLNRLTYLSANIAIIWSVGSDIVISRSYELETRGGGVLSCISGGEGVFVGARSELQYEHRSAPLIDFRFI